MRWNAVAIVVLSIGAGAGLAGCGDPSPAAKNVQQKLSESWDAMKVWGVEKKDDLIRGASQKLDELKQAVATAKSAGSEAGAATSQTLDEEWKVVQGKFDAMKTASGEEWVKARDAFVSAFEGLKARVAGADGR